jgi:hypothetical protein
VTLADVKSPPAAGGGVECLVVPAASPGLFEIAVGEQRIQPTLFDGSLAVASDGAMDQSVLELPLPEFPRPFESIQPLGEFPSLVRAVAYGGDAVVVTSVPEPASAALLIALGLPAFFMRRVRRRVTAGRQ